MGRQFWAKFYFFCGQSVFNPIIESPIPHPPIPYPILTLG